MLKVTPVLIALVLNTLLFSTSRRQNSMVNGVSILDAYNGSRDPQPPELIDMPVITACRRHRNVDRFPALARVRHFHGSSRDQQLGSHRREDGSEWRHQQLVLPACPSHSRWQARPNAQRLRIDAQINLIQALPVQSHWYC